MAMIFICVVVFLIQISSPGFDNGHLFYSYGVVPTSLLGIEPLPNDLNKIDPYLTLMSSGITVPADVVFSVGLGGENDYMFAHKNSPARDAMKSQFDSLYGTKGQREIAYQFANASGVSPADMDRIAGQKFAEELKNGTYSVYDPKSVSAIGNHALDYIQYRSKVPIPTEARTALDSYNQEVFKLTQIPHPKRSGFIKQIVSDIAGFATDAASNVAGAIGLDKYSSAILTAGLTALGVPPNIAAGLAAAAPSMAAGEFGDALKSAGVGFAAGQAGQAAGRLLTGATGNAVVDKFLSNAAGGAVAGGTAALLTGQNFGKGVTGGLVTAGGMPDRVKCLHSLVAHALAAGEDVNQLE